MRPASSPLTVHILSESAKLYLSLRPLTDQSQHMRAKNRQISIIISVAIETDCWLHNSQSYQYHISRSFWVCALTYFTATMIPIRQKEQWNHWRVQWCHWIHAFDVPWIFAVIDRLTKDILHIWKIGHLAPFRSFERAYCWREKMEGIVQLLAGRSIDLMWVGSH